MTTTENATTAPAALPDARVIQMGTSKGRGTVVAVKRSIGTDMAAVQWDDRSPLLVDWVAAADLTVTTPAPTAEATPTTEAPTTEAAPAAHAAYTDEALREKVATSCLRGEVRSAQILLGTLTTPADRAEAASRQIGLMNRLRVRGSEAMRLAALSVRDGDPRFTDEYHPNCPTA